MNFSSFSIIMTVELSYTVYVWLVPIGLSFLYSFPLSLLLYHRGVYFFFIPPYKPFPFTSLDCLV
ncbi:hypothetical protein BO79DRAFT_54593 [Aspergillus costaricaensis CBS 115574]|uniref:Uncharacterized protein n=1 Tax=Aspergillus costaricaensis CBS 115574 TaxID=1448317 RepID=A0ACD1IRC4_9EURO|nr:hypothetical protein BO79DRAFT_54593 [Aspergillus costaricaensis CBS 115574]RAK92618.1 hypothetical protein BO79DRAFT_54593 [Aspergillus costaricaensis CBS 115574]